MKNTNNKKKLLFFIIIYNIVFILPFDNYLIKFNSAEEIFEYSYPSKKIFNIFETSVDAFVVYDGGTTYFEKVEDNYEFITSNSDINNMNGIKFKTLNLENSYTVFMTITPNGSKLLKVYNKNNSNQSFEITDSLNSKIHIANLGYYIVIEPSVEEYALIINNENYYLNFN